MPALVSELEREGFVLPKYNESNLELARQLAVGKGNLIGRMDKRVTLLLDGLGYNLVESFINSGRVKSELFRKAAVSRITSLFPTITPNILTSMYSGIVPADHGILGTAMPLKSGKIANVLKWKEFYSHHNAELDEDPGELYPKSLLLQKMSREQKLILLYNEIFLGGKVTTHLLSGCDTRPFVAFEDMLVTARDLVLQGEHEHIFAYNDVIDRIGHVYTKNSDYMLETLSALLSAIDRILLPVLKDNGYNLVITTDHGQLDTVSNDTVYISYRDELAKYLEMPMWCETRLRIARVKPGKEDAFEECFAKNYGKAGMLVRSEDVIKSGILGRDSVPAEKRYLFGTHMILPKSDHTFVYQPEGWERKMRPRSGQHGCLSADEVYIPAVVY